MFAFAASRSLRSVARSTAASSSSSAWVASSSSPSSSRCASTPLLSLRASARGSLRSIATTAVRSQDAAPVDPKIGGIVDQIEKLTLLEAAELVSQLKTRLNITEIAMPAASAAGAPAAAAADADAGAAEEAKPKEKTVFNVKLTGLKDASAKAKVIREVKALNANMNLVEAKKFVESAPQTLKEGLTKEEAEKLQKAIEAAGGTVELE
ncbi:54S ribosomal protein L12, mitochondrial [Thecaphora frezii]